MVDQVKNRDWQKLSESLDDQLNPNERKILEGRLKQNPDLRQALDELRVSRLIMRSMPRIKAPRNFTLDASMVDVQARASKGIIPTGIWSMASVFAVLLLLFFLAGDFFTTSRILMSRSGEVFDEAVAEPMMSLMVDEEAVEAPVLESEMALEAAVAEEAVLSEEAPSEKSMPGEGEQNLREGPPLAKEPSGGGGSEADSLPADSDYETGEVFGQVEEILTAKGFTPEMIDELASSLDSGTTRTFLNIPRRTLTNIEVALAIILVIAVSAWIALTFDKRDRRN